MPPDEGLGETEVAALTRWVEIGAPWPDSEVGEGPDRARLAREHWAFQTVTDPRIPIVKELAWCDSPIDAFVLTRLEASDLLPAAAADRRALLRRLSYDLTGLPPSYADVVAFERDASPDAYERRVDRLLASPAHGVQWARHWLDVARYSDTKGYVYAREERFWVHSWVYRDWVIEALNNDLPYDDFVRLQLAADRFEPADPANLAAMGYLTLGRRFLGVTHDIIDDRIDVVTRGMLGLTVSCARCHDHKFDPIPTQDYYSLYGVFQNCTEKMARIEEEPGRDRGDFEAGLREREENLAKALMARRSEAAARARARVADYLLAQTEMHKYPEEGFDQVLEEGDVIPATVRRWRDYLNRVEREHDPIFAAWVAYSRLPKDQFGAMAADVAAPSDREIPWNRFVAEAFVRPPASMRDVATRYGELFKEVLRQRGLQIEEAVAQGGPAPASLADPDAEAIREFLESSDSPCEPPNEGIVGIETYFPTSVTVELWKLQGELDRWLIQSPDAAAHAVYLVDRPYPRDARVFRRGNPANSTDIVPRRFLEVLSKETRSPFSEGSGRRELAEAIAAPTNPLTSRVQVNRVWQHHFGAGLVKTASDFGTRAEPPSHPELLDWLASRLVQEGWSVKRLHREMVCSSTYRQSSEGTQDAGGIARAEQIDPENRLLWRMPLRRLGFEETRDSFVRAAGCLDDSIGGKGEELFSEPWSRRRAIFGLIDREFFPSVLRVFDVANPDLHIPQRAETVVPQQALFFLNHESIGYWSEEIVRSLSHVDSSRRESRIAELYRRIFQRDPTAEELELSFGLLESAALESPPAVRATAAHWRYGFAAFDPETGKLGEFHELPHYSGSAWQGGENWPDAKLGWVRLTAEGGHPGNDIEHSVVRRWVADRDGTVSIDSAVTHSEASGDGVRASIVHSGERVVLSQGVHARSEEMSVASLSLRAGETLDFVVDRAETLHCDDFLWKISIRELDRDGEALRVWDAKEDFVPIPRKRLDPWQQLAQVLFLSNEFVFVD